MSSTRACVLVPTYNNAATVEGVLRAIQAAGERDILVVNDGSTDGTAAILARIDGITVLTNDRNRGKGFSLRRGFEAALAQGFAYAITIDSDRIETAGTSECVERPGLGAVATGCGGRVNEPGARLIEDAESDIGGIAAGDRVAEGASRA